MKRIACLLAPLFVLLAVYSGCVAHGDLSGLSIELVKLEAAADGSLVATLQFNNDTVRALNLASSSHQLILNGQPVGQLSIQDPLGLAPQHSVTQTVVLKNPAGLAPVAGTATYRLDSSLTILLYGEDKEVRKLSHVGTVSIR